MKAAVIDRHGGPDVFRYAEVPDPEAGPGEVLVDVHAASVNAADWQVRRGDINPDKQFPYILGRDFSGIVVGAGEGVGDLRPGDAVFAVVLTEREATYAERVAVDATIVAPKPAGFSHVEAAAMALTGLTAIVTLEHTLDLRGGETILIQGGAGGVASFAIQLARHIGARVVTTASAANHDYVRELGAHEVIDYTRVDFTEAVSGCDAVFDTVGGDVALRSFDVLRPGGRAAFIASGPTAPRPTRSDVTALRPDVGRKREHLARIAALHEAGVVAVPPIARFPLAEAAAAHRISEGRHLRGKLVLEVR